MQRHTLAARWVALGALALLGACSGSSDPLPGDTTITTLSNRADLISGGSALVEITLPAGAVASSLVVDLDDTNISSSFVKGSDGRILGVVKGLKNGTNILRARAADGQFAGATLTITNAPIGGPVLLSAQTTPWVCATPTAVAATATTPASNASGLSTNAIDAQCNIATEYKLFYRTTTAGCSTALPDPSPPAVAAANNCFKPYTAGMTYPDLATTTTTAGVTVPYIVRVERGTLNRGIYDIVVLFDPTKTTAWTPLAPQAQWNGKVVYSFGASTGQPRLQYRTEQNWADDAALSRGFMVVDHSLTDSLYNSNRVLVAETLMMMKEHITRSYGQIKYTLGNGCSGGSIQQNTIASTFPGLLDGLQPACDYPDSITTGLEVTDCVLLVNFYAGTDWQALNAGLTSTQINAKKTAINGHLDHTACHGWNNLFGTNGKPGNYVPMVVADNTTGAVVVGGAPRNNCQLPASQVYDPVTNPNGPRCGDADASVAVWGTTAGLVSGSKRALSTTDNVGVQYGLGALLAQTISPDEFVTLNEKIGGYDVDANFSAARAVADAAALDIAYKSGIVGSGKNQGKLPIIDSRGYDESYGNLALGQYGIHQYWRSYSQRARIAAANGGNSGNQVIWRYGYSLTPATPAQVNAVTVASLTTMDTWLSALLTSAPKTWLNGERTQAQVIAAKPAAAVDLCYLSSDVNFANKITDAAVCNADPRLVPRASPRQVAGGSVQENILKCQLKPLSFSNYTGITFTAAQQSRLQAVFSSGVCDWSKPGAGQQEAISPLTYKAGPGGAALPPAPVSSRI